MKTRIIVERQISLILTTEHIEQICFTRLTEETLLFEYLMSIQICLRFCIRLLIDEVIVARKMKKLITWNHTLLFTKKRKGTFCSACEKFWNAISYYIYIKKVHLLEMPVYKKTLNIANWQVPRCCLLSLPFFKLGTIVSKSYSSCIAYV